MMTTYSIAQAALRLDLSYQMTHKLYRDGTLSGRVDETGPYAPKTGDTRVELNIASVESERARRGIHAWARHLNESDRAQLVAAVSNTARSMARDRDRPVSDTAVHVDGKILDWLLTTPLHQVEIDHVMDEVVLPVLRGDT